MAEREQIRVLVASDDPDFRRLAAVALSRAGQSVRTTSLSPARVPRLLRRETVDVIVLEGVEPSEALALTAGYADRLGVVRIQPEGTLGVTKWGPLPALIAEVQIAAELAGARRQDRGPRIVS